MIAAAELVADAAAGHPVEREQHHRRAGRGAAAGPLRRTASRRLRVAAVLVEQEDEVDGLGELGPAGVLGVEAEPAVLGVELLGQLAAALGRDRAR